jgi:hypothetical protein
MKRTVILVLVVGSLLLAMSSAALAAGKMGSAGDAFDPYARSVDLLVAAGKLNSSDGFDRALNAFPYITGGESGGADHVGTRAAGKLNDGSSSDGFDRAAGKLGGAAGGFDPFTDASALIAGRKLGAGMDHPGEERAAGKMGGSADGWDPYALSNVTDIAGSKLGTVMDG